MIARWRGGLLAWCAALLSAGVAGAEENAPRSLHFPDVRRTGLLRIGAGATLDVLPTRTVEAELRLVPRASIDARFGLPGGLFTDLRLAGNVLANELSVAWGASFTAGRVAAALHERASFWFGYVGVEGFDATSWGLFTLPGGSVGIRDDDGTRTTLTVEAILGHARHDVVGELTIEKRQLAFEGIATRLSQEIRVGAGDVYYGVSLLWARPDYQIWLAFSDSDRRQLFPRFHAGYSFLRARAGDGVPRLLRRRADPVRAAGLHRRWAPARRHAAARGRPRRAGRDVRRRRG